MSETDSQNGIETDNSAAEAFSDALASLEEHLQEHQEENELYDEEAQENLMYEEGTPEEDGLFVGDELEAALDSAFTDPNEGSFAAPTEAAATDSSAEDYSELDDELDNLFTDPNEGSFAAPTEAAAEDSSEAEESSEESTEDFEDYPSYEDSYEDSDEDTVAAESAEETAEETIEEEAAKPEFAEADDMDEEAEFEADAAEEAEVMEEVAVAEEAAPTEAESHPMAAMIGHDGGASDFNLATLNQLVEEIRQESQRVSDMKESVAKALNLIQEMSESLKS